MQKSYLLSVDYPAFLPQEAETTTPRPPIPIFYIHSLKHPYCKKPSCPCQHHRHEALRLMGSVADGQVLLADAALLMEERATVRSSTTRIDQPRRTQIHIDLVPDVPEECQLFWHTWQITENRDVYECSLCHVRGYCPQCTPIAPDGAQPFTCSEHAGQTERK